MRKRFLNVDNNDLHLHLNDNAIKNGSIIWYNTVTGWNIFLKRNHHRAYYF